MASVGLETKVGRSSVERIRSHFPALERRHNGFPVAYFDGPGGTQVPREVVEAVADYLYHHNANTHWAYPTSAETDAAIAQAREALADFLNASPNEIAFGANMTTLTFHLARALGRHWNPGDEIVVTELDHHGNVAPWQASLDRIREHARSGANLMPAILEAVERYATVGEIASTLREVFGEYRETVVV